ncbi:MAG: LolA-like protein, partial [Planctomycetota bacterium]
MQNKITKFAIAAIVLMAVALSVTLFDKTIPSAYAIEQTIEAYNSIRWVHIVESATFSFGESRSSEIWLGCDEQGNVTRLRYQSANVGEPVGSLVITGGFDSSEAWLAKHNLHLVGYGNPSVLLDYDVYELDPKYLFENLFDQESRGEAIVDVNEPKDKTEPIIVTVTYPEGSRSLKWKKVIYINKATKLVTKVEKYELRGKEFILLKSLEFFDYNQPIDKMMFTLDGDVSSDAKVVDMTDVEAGLLQGDMTDEELANELTKQFLEAAIAKDFYKAGQLYLAAPGFLVEQAFMGANVVKIISMGIAHRDPDP